jgi:hypothetical protein
MSLGPPVERGQRRHERLTQWSQRIVHTRGHDWIDGSPYQPIALKRAQRLRQHLLGHTDRPTRLAVPPGSLASSYRMRSPHLVQILVKIVDVERRAPELMTKVAAVGHQPTESVSR